MPSKYSKSRRVRKTTRRMRRPSGTKRRLQGPTSARKRLFTPSPRRNSWGSSLGGIGRAAMGAWGQYSRYRSHASSRYRGAAGKAPIDAASGAKLGFRVGSSRLKRGTLLQKRRRMIGRIVMDNAYPVIKDHALQPVTQMDWTSNTQGVFEYVIGYTTAEVEDFLRQSNDASYAAPPTVTPTFDTLTNQKLDLFNKTTKFNLKNTSSHTSYVHARVYKVKGYHSFSLIESWVSALANDNMVQNAATHGTEEATTAPGNRPDMKFAELNVRFSEDKSCRKTFPLEPGQETSYTHITPGRRFDKQKFNVKVGSTATSVDPDFMPTTSIVVFFCRSETVTDALDTDVTYGSGHIAITKEEWKSWSAIPFCKPVQKSFRNNWGTIVEAQEEDLNQYQANNDPYEELR